MDKARKAAEAVAAFENRFAKVDTDLMVLKWMVGTVLAVTIPTMIKVFSH